MMRDMFRVIGKKSAKLKRTAKAVGKGARAEFLSKPIGTSVLVGGVTAAVTGRFHQRRRD
jgi:hypothetical protein